MQPTFMHNGAFTSLEAAIWHHLSAIESAKTYSPAAHGLAEDLTGAVGPIEPVLARLDLRLAEPPTLSAEQFAQLVAFVRHGLLDPRATPDRLRALVPAAVPSGRPMLVFEFP